jgi:hypothetical protein
MIDTFSTLTLELCSTGKRGFNLMFFPEVSTISNSTISLKKKENVIMIKLYDEGESSTEHTCLYHIGALNDIKDYIINRLIYDFKSEIIPRDRNRLDTDAEEFLKECNITVMYEMLSTIKDAIYLGLLEQDDKVLDLLDELPPRDAW